MAPWYRDGLRFECTQCGNCCTGGPGHVWVTAEEIAAMAGHLGMQPDDFETRFVRTVGARKSLVELPERNWDCVFLDASRRCTVYEVRPRQCRTWPFWESNLASKRAWEGTCQVCPGAGTGKLVPLEEIERQAALVRI
jgi:uncharacterized protein